MNQRLDRVGLLAPLLREPLTWFIQQVRAQHGIVLHVAFTWRSVQEQQLIYQKGRAYNRETDTWEVSDQAQVVTNATPGRSPHNVVAADGKPASMAADLFPLAADGSVWYPTGFTWWQPLYDLAWKAGLDPLGDTVGAYLAGDWGHFEEPGWKLKLAALNLVRPTSDVTI